MSDRLTELTTAIYSRVPDAPFSEEFASYKNVRLGADAVEARITTPVHDAIISQIRIDFSRFPVSFYLDSLTVSQSNGANVFIFTPDYDWKNNSADIKITRQPNGTIFECLSNESSLLISVPEAVSSTELVVSFSVRGISEAVSSDKGETAEIRALNYLLTEQEDLSRYIAELLYSQDNEWAKAQQALSRIHSVGAEADKSISLLRTKQAEIFHNLSEFREISDKSLNSLKELYEARFSSLTKKINGLSDDILSHVEKSSARQIENQDQKYKLLLSEFKIYSTGIFDRISENSQNIINLYNVQNEKIDQNSIAIHNELIRISTLNIDKIVEQSIEQKIYIRTGINAIRRDLDDNNPLPIMENLSSKVEINSKYQVSLLEDILENMSNVALAKDMNVRMAARILSNKYRYKDASNLIQEPTDLDEATTVIRELREELLQARAMVEVVLRSRSWYLTKPFRFIARLASRLIRPAPRTDGTAQKSAT